MSHSSLSLSRREWLKLSAAGVSAYSMSGWLENLAAAAAKSPERKRSCILLWMAGGPSQMDTFDLKPGQANGGPYKEIATPVPGIKISEHLPKLATHMKDMVLVRSMSTKEADHGRATYYLRTGRVPGGPIQYPPLGSFVAKELERPDAELPSFVSISPFRGLNSAAFTPGFLGPRYAPLIVGENAAPRSATARRRHRPGAARAGPRSARAMSTTAAPMHVLRCSRRWSRSSSRNIPASPPRAIAPLIAAPSP